jgi:nickel-dependent lactate racemase
LVAPGIHYPNFGVELGEIVGVEIVANYRILNHYSERLETHTDLGTTENGTPVLIDRTCVEADLKNTTALIEPHLMTGYSGARQRSVPD